MAHFIAVTKNAIRVQLPGGVNYAPALHQAAAKTSARSGLTTRHATALNQMVESSVAVLNSGDSSIITLEMRVHDRSISAKLTGKGCGSPAAKLSKQLEALAAKNAQCFETKATTSALIISFKV